jgi:hypothetical protein
MHFTIKGKLGVKIKKYCDLFLPHPKMLLDQLSPYSMDTIPYLMPRLRIRLHSPYVFMTWCSSTGKTLTFTFYNFNDLRKAKSKTTVMIISADGMKPQENVSY